MRFRIRRNNDGAEESKRALEDAEHNLAQVKKRDKEVSRVTDALRELRERNHFGEQLEAIITGRTP